MLKFVRNWFRRLISVFLWVVLAGFVIGGFVLGLRSFGAFSIFIILGGVAAGLFAVIIGGGYIATILNIDDNLQKIADHYAKENN